MCVTERECVCEREREREREGERGRERDRDRDRETEREGERETRSTRGVFMLCALRVKKEDANVKICRARRSSG